MRAEERCEKVHPTSGRHEDMLSTIREVRGLGAVVWMLLTLYVVFGVLAGVLGGNILVNLLTNISAGCATGFVVVFAQEWLRLQRREGA
jgi:hypothetical protein